MFQRNPYQRQEKNAQNDLELYSHPYEVTDASYTSVSYPPASCGPSSPDNRTNQASSSPFSTSTSINPYHGSGQPSSPCNHHSAASSSVTLEASPTAVYQNSISDKRRLISSFYSGNSRPESSNMDPREFETVELHGGQNKTHGNSTDRNGGNAEDLSSIPSSPRPSISQKPKKSKGFWSSMPRKLVFRPRGVDRPRKANSIGNKKAKFSNERTMVHWITAAMLLGSLAMTLLSFGENNVTPFIGVALLVICLMTLIYSTTVFQVRMEWLNMRRDDVLYYDRFAPTVLTVLIMGTFGFNAVGDFPTNKLYLKH